MFLPTTCTSLIPFNDHNFLTFNSGLPRFTNFMRNQAYVPDFLEGVFVGILLGDGGFGRKKKN